MSLTSLDPARSPLLTDLYMLTMLNAYIEAEMRERAVFEFFVRKLPPSRGFLVVAGLEQALSYLESFRIGEDEIEALRELRRFGPRFFDELASLRFTGDVDAMPEGTIAFENEPLLRVTAPIAEAQIVEARLINLLHFQTLIASKAARSTLVAPGKSIVDFGLRRAHGAEAGMLTARATYLAGFTGTSTVLAGLLWKIPLFGTIAHSFIQAHEREEDAFRSFAESSPGGASLLLDTYDTVEGAKRAVHVARELASRGIHLKGVRLDSGDLASLSHQVRRIFDEAGFPDLIIVASGGLDEYRIQALTEASAPIDVFGVGTRVAISEDAPSLDCAYKLQAYAGRPSRKRSPGKATWPGIKQVSRRIEGGTMRGDLIHLEGEPAEGEALLRPVMRGGKRLEEAESLATIRGRCQRGLEQLPSHLHALETQPAYPVGISERILELVAKLNAGTGG